ncbi:HEAT repeat-containing protein 6 [Modicella reniformis]|uniref:HEAT repeat-containing protein 6 n=1 Tax=Modicella reniformis TaxID=1440133 RepID=A0A9P6MKW2_9FUNG|nr:HEAT repeat-containing protein 6 [Modicella reniformis]
MAQASRQRHFRHHKGTSTQRRLDSEDFSRRNLGPRQFKESSPRVTSDSSQPRSGDTASLKDELVRLLEQAKEAGSDKAKETEDMQNFSQNAQEKLLLACRMLSLESPDDVDLMSKTVFALFNQDLVKAAAVSPSNRLIVDTLCRFFVSALKQDGAWGVGGTEANSSNSSASNASTEPAERMKIDVLRALSTVLFENGSQVKDSLQDLFQVVVTICGKVKRHEQSELRRMALNCLANLVHKTGSLFSTLHERMYEIILTNLATTAQYEGTPATSLGTTRRRDRGSERKLISSALRALHFLLQEDKSLSTRSIPPLMNVICRFMFFTSENSSTQPVSSTNSSAFTVGVIQRSSYSIPANTIPLTRSTGMYSNSLQILDNSEGSYITYLSMQSSDSEYSDSDSSVLQAQRKQHDGKVRLNALLCLQALARAAPKQLQPHWPKFLTSSNSAPMIPGTYKAPSLVGLIGTDPIYNIRSAACVVLGNIMDSSKQYLAMAEEIGKSHTGLLALSERIGLMTRELHESIALAMTSVDSTMDQGIVIQMMKCCSSIVANCSYEKMKPGLILLPLRPIDKYLDSNGKQQLRSLPSFHLGSRCSRPRINAPIPTLGFFLEPSLQSAALVFLTTLFSNTSAQSDVRRSILVKVTDSEDKIPRLISRLLGFIEDAQIPAVVRVEAWNALRAIGQFHFEVASVAWTWIDTALANEQNLEDVRMRSAGMLFLEEYSKSGANATDPLTATWWKDVLERHVLKAFAEENSSIKALGCDCISNLPASVFNCLPSRLEMLIMSLVLGTALDDHASTRAAACRAIGVFILFPSLREDSTHMSDMATTVLDLCHDPNMNVRVRASWAVGNLCDALVLLKTSGGQGHVLDEILTLTFWTKIMKSALSICQDHEKLKSNGIRAIGGLLRVTFEGILERERHSLVKDAVYALIKHMEQGSLKGRWNACYAMQNVLLNPDFPIGSTAGTSYALDSDMVSWTNDVYGALLQAVQQSKNFKVRINACAALSVPKTKAKYGDQAMLRKMVQVLMTAVQNLDNDQGEHAFSEFQYRDQLEVKLLRCLDHLLQLAGGVASLDLEMDPPPLLQRIIASRPQNVEETLITSTETEL